MLMDVIYAACIVLEEFICRVIFSIFIQSSSTDPHTIPILSTQNDKETREKPETNKPWTVRAFLQNLAYVYCNITVLQTNVQQIHHK